MTDYGDCPECGQPLGTDPDRWHTWTDGISDCHADCCRTCKDQWDAEVSDA